MMTLADDSQVPTYLSQPEYTSVDFYGPDLRASEFFGNEEYRTTMSFPEWRQQRIDAWRHRFD